MTTKILARPRQFVEYELQAESIYLLPLRLFIGIGWIRASLEKLVTAGWYDGTALNAFFQQQLADGRVVFPFYRELITSVFAPNAAVLGQVIMAGQLLVGLAILFGFLTNFALQWGMFMNLNFILAGAVTPSAFYMVIQAALLVANTGAVFGLDHVLSRRIPLRFLAARTTPISPFWRWEKAYFFLATLVAVIAGVTAVPFIRDYGPHSVEDPAMLMLVMSVFNGLTALVCFLRIGPDEYSGERTLPVERRQEQ